MFVSRTFAGSGRSLAAGSFENALYTTALVVREAGAERAVARFQELCADLASGEAGCA